VVDEPKPSDNQVQKKTKKQLPESKRQTENEVKAEKSPKTDMPKATKKEVVEEKSSPDEPINKGESMFFNHEIKFGENLYRIAIKYNVTQKQLIEINGKKAESLVSGSILKIPVKAIHKVVSSESLSTISDKYNVKIKLICAASSIEEGSALKEGQVLVIPMSK